MALQVNQYENNTLIQSLKSIGRTEDYEIEPDNRMELVKTIPTTVNGHTYGDTIVDGGYYSDGDKYVLSAIFDNATYESLKTLWETRAKVEVIFDDNTTLTDAVIVIRSVSYTDNLIANRRKYKKVKMEIWKDCRLWL